MIDKTVAGIYRKTIQLIDEQDDETGAVITAGNSEFGVRAIEMLNTLIDEVYPASDTYRPSECGERPALPDITRFEDEPDLDARIIRQVLPYGLAAHLCVLINPMLSNYFEQKYEEALEDARRKLPSEFEDIYDPYGGIEKGEFSRR